MKKRLVSLLLVVTLLFVGTKQQYGMVIAKAENIKALTYKNATGSAIGLTLGGLLTLIIGMTGYVVNKNMTGDTSMGALVDVVMDDVYKTGRLFTKDGQNDVAKLGIAKGLEVGSSLVDLLANGGVSNVDYFAYPVTHSSGGRSFTIPNDTIKAVEEILDKHTTSVPSSFIKYSYSDFIDSKPLDSVEKRFYNFSTEYYGFISSLSSKLTYHLSALDGSTKFHVVRANNPSLISDDGGIFIVYDNAVKAFRIYVRLSYIQNTGNNNKYEFTEYIMEPSSYSVGKVYTDRSYTTLFEKVLYLDSSEIVNVDNGIIPKEVKIRIFDLLKQNLQFVNHDIPVHDPHMILNPTVKTLGGDLTKLDSASVISSNYVRPKVAVEVNVNDYLLQEIDKIRVDVARSTKEIMDSIEVAQTKAKADGKEVYSAKEEVVHDDDVTIPDVTGFWAKLWVVLQSIWDVSADILEGVKAIPSYVASIPSSVASAIGNIVEGVFAYDVDIVSLRVENIRENILNRTGILSYPFSFLVRFLNGVKESAVEDCIFVIPTLSFMNYTLLNKTTFNFSEYLRRQEFKGIYSSYKVASGVAMVFSLFYYMFRKVDEILRGD